MKTTTLYDFTLTAGGAQVILADANMYKVLTATGDISVTRDGGATIKPLRAGRGERNVAFQRLILRDLSGAPNSGTILVGDSDFIDDTIVLSSAINVRPEAQSGFFNDGSAVTANTPLTVFTPAANTGGAILFQATGQLIEVANVSGGFVTKASAPATIFDGTSVAAWKMTNSSGNFNAHIDVQTPQYIAAGQGLYYITTQATTGGQTWRGCRYKLL